MDLLTGMTFLAKGMSGVSDKAAQVGWGWKIAFLALGIFWVVMLTHCLRRKFKITQDKIAWILVLVFLPIIGAFIYLYDHLKK